MSPVTAILVIAGLLAANAFFVAAEFALVSARRSQLEPKAAAGSRRARVALAAMRRVSLMMAGAQLGITVCTLGLGAVGEPAIAHLLEGPFAALGAPESLLHPVSFAIALVLVTALHVVVGEMVPKNLTLAAPDRAALILGPPMSWLVRATRPVMAGLNAAANGVLRLLRVEPQEEITQAYTHADVASFVAESHREGLLDADELQLVSGALRFAGHAVSDIAPSLDEVVTVSDEVTPSEVERLAARTGQSRCYVRSVDGEVRGYLHLRDVLTDPPDEPIPSVRIRRMLTVHADEPATEVLAALRRERGYLARVVDGRTTTRVVTMDEILAAILTAGNPPAGAGSRHPPSPSGKDP